MRTVLLTTPATNHGEILTLTDADLQNGNSFVNDGATILGIYNPGPDTLTITIKVTKLVDGDLTVQPRVYTTPPLATHIIGRLPKDVYNQTDGNVWMDFSGPALVGVVSM